MHTMTMTTGFFLLLLLLLACTIVMQVTAFNVFAKSSKASTSERANNVSPPKTPQLPPLPQLNGISLPKHLQHVSDDMNPLTPSVWNDITSTALGFASKLAPKTVRQNSQQTSQITVNRLPPDSFQVDLSDVPIIGKALSGTYRKVKDLKQQRPSIVISSPQDKWGALQKLSDQGTLCNKRWIDQGLCALDRLRVTERNGL